MGVCQHLTEFGGPPVASFDHDTPGEGLVGLGSQQKPHGDWFYIAASE